MPSARPKFFWPAKFKFWLAKNNLAGQKHQNPIQKWRSKKFLLAKFCFGWPKIFLVEQMASALVSLFRYFFTVPTPPNSVCDLYCFKGLIMLVFHEKNTNPFYWNKQGGRYITERSAGTVFCHKILLLTLFVVEKVI